MTEKPDIEYISRFFVPGSDASPYYLRDLATIFFVQAATRYLRLQP